MFCFIALHNQTPHYTKSSSLLATLPGARIPLHPYPNEVPVAANQTYAELRDQYLRTLSRAASPSTYAAARQALAILDDIVGKDTHNQPFVHVSITTLDTYLNHLQTHHSIETEHLYLRAVIDFFTTIYTGVGGDVLRDLTNLTERLKARRRTKAHDIQLPPAHLVDKLLTTAQRALPPTSDHITERHLLQFLRDRAFILVLADTGLRASEIIELRRHQFATAEAINLDEESTLPISPAARRALSAYLTARQALDGAQQHLPLANLPLFARHDKRAGNRILPISRWTAANIVNYWTAQALTADEQAELDASGQTISPHTFRHYFVLNAIQQSDTLADAQTRARHDDPSTTRRYRALLTTTDD